MKKYFKFQSINTHTLTKKEGILYSLIGFIIDEFDSYKNHNEITSERTLLFKDNLFKQQVKLQSEMK